jgi:ribosomal protein S18 acetylase RimI-like enzyme
LKVDGVIDIREFRWSDYDAVAAVWVSAGRDVLTRSELEVKLTRDPQLFLVAEDAERLVGVVLGTFDGRRGWIVRLAVDPGHRRLGIASRLVGELETRFAALGCPKVNLLAMPQDSEALQFWMALGYERRPDVVCSKQTSN